MKVTTYHPSSRQEIEGLVDDAKIKGKTASEIEAWAHISIQDVELRTYCIERARQILER